MTVEVFKDGRHAGQTMIRETLVREFGAGGGTLCVCMQNPSKAEADDPAANDPTVLTVMGFTQRLGFGRLVVVNTYPRRSTDPAEMYRWLYAMGLDGREEARAQALAIVLREARAADQFIAAWGNGDGKDPWPRRLADAIVVAGISIYAFGFTNSGAPKHPLARGLHRIPRDQKPVLWRAA